MKIEGDLYNVTLSLSLLQAHSLPPTERAKHRETSQTSQVSHMGQVIAFFTAGSIMQHSPVNIRAMRLHFDSECRWLGNYKPGYEMRRTLWQLDSLHLVVREEWTFLYFASEIPHRGIIAIQVKMGTKERRFTGGFKLMTLSLSLSVLRFFAGLPSRAKGMPWWQMLQLSLLFTEFPHVPTFISTHSFRWRPSRKFNQNQNHFPRHVAAY